MKESRPVIKDDTEILQDLMAAWNKADVALTASFYADKLEYRDPMVPRGIFSKAEFVRYLETLFNVWPRQKWVLKKLMPHAAEGAYSAEYEFEFAGERTAIKGYGMDRLELDNGKIVLNHVYLNAENWRDWIVGELKKNP